MDSYIEVKDKQGNLIGKYDSKQFRELIGGARTGFAKDWVDQYNRTIGKENGLTAELVFDIIKRGKRKRFGEGMSKARELLNELNEGKEFEYFVNKDERGEFEADIRDPKGKTVWEGDTEVFRELIDDGYMKHKDDLKGLVSHLIDMKVLPKGASVSKGN